MVMDGDGWWWFGMVLGFRCLVGGIMGMAVCLSPVRQVGVV